MPLNNYKVFLKTDSNIDNLKDQETTIKLSTAITTFK